jgi:hypothetical protein
MPEETISPAELAMCECETCKRKAGLPNRLAPGMIHSYSSMPRSGWVPRRVGEADATAPTFGVELETDVPEYQCSDLPNRPTIPYLAWDATPAHINERAAAERAYYAWSDRNDAHHRRNRDRWVADGNMTGEEAVSVAEPRGMWHPKHDGSVTGPEFASQPATLAYWRAQRPALASMFRALLHGGMRSHDGDRCGFHVNIGTDAFADASHLERFMALVAHNARWTTRMSQRTHASQRTWASYDGIATAAQRSSIARDVFAYGYRSVSHSSAVNTSHSGRIEFRVPRGSLRLDRFYAKLEWVASMVEFTRDSANATTPHAYMAWVDADPTAYPAVLAYMRERFAARFGGEA